MATPDAPSTPPDVAVVTVSFGSESVLPPFLNSLSDASDRPFSVVVADNRPEPSSPIADMAGAASAHYLPLSSNLGYGGAINAAVQQLDRSIEWLVISNPDVVLRPGAIDTMLERARSDSTIGAVGPAIYGADGELYPSARAVPSLRTGIGHALFANIWLGNPWTRAYRNDNGDGSTPRDTGWLSGACLLIRRDAFDELHGFDSGYFMYFEDVDLGYRLGKAGYRNVYEPSAVVIHTGAHATESDSAAMIRAHHDSARRFLNRKYAGALLWPIRAVLGASLSIRSALMRRRITQTISQPLETNE